MANLDNCAKLLTDIMDKEPEKKKTVPKMKSSKVNGKAVVPGAKNRKPQKEKKSSKVIVSKKVYPPVSSRVKSTTRVNNKCVNKDNGRGRFPTKSRHDELLQSDADDSVKTRSEGPPSLNGTETVAQAAAISNFQKEVMRKAGQIFETKAPNVSGMAGAYNSRLVSSTPNTTLINQQRQNLGRNYGGSVDIEICNDREIPHNIEASNIQKEQALALSIQKLMTEKYGSNNPSLPDREAAHAGDNCLPSNMQPISQSQSQPQIHQGTTRIPDTEAKGYHEALQSQALINNYQNLLRQQVTHSYPQAAGAFTGIQNYGIQPEASMYSSLRSGHLDPKTMQDGFRLGPVSSEPPLPASSYMYGLGHAGYPNHQSVASQPIHQQNQGLNPTIGLQNNQNRYLISTIDDLENIPTKENGALAANEMHSMRGAAEIQQRLKYPEQGMNPMMTNVTTHSIPQQAQSVHQPLQGPPNTNYGIPYTRGVPSEVIQSVASEDGLRMSSQHMGVSTEYNKTEETQMATQTDPTRHVAPEKEKVYLVHAGVNTTMPHGGEQGLTSVNSETQTSQITSSQTQPESSSSTAPTSKSTSDTAAPTTTKKTGGTKKKQSKQTGQLRELGYLVRELREVPGVASDSEVNRLVTEIDLALSTLKVGKAGNLDWRMEMELAMQPLRSENADLRRQLRIMGKQHKELERAAEEASKPDPSFDLIHLRMLNHTLEGHLKDEKTSKEKLQQRVKVVTSEVEKLTDEKRELLQLINSKDSDHLKSQQDWVGEVSKMRMSVESHESEYAAMKRKADALDHELQIRDISLKEKESEVQRLQNLVRGLQDSMKTLLSDLQSTQSQPAHHWGPAMETLQHAYKEMHDHKHVSPPHNIPDMHPSRETESNAVKLSPVSKTHISPKLTQPGIKPPVASESTAKRALTEQVLKEHEEMSGGLSGKSQKHRQPMTAGHYTHTLSHNLAQPLEHHTQTMPHSLAQPMEPHTQVISPEYHTKVLSPEYSKQTELDCTEGTQYLSPPPGQGQGQPQRSPGGGITVKDVLGSLADRMRQQNLAKSYEHKELEEDQYNADNKEMLEEEDEEEEFDDLSEGPIEEGDSTLVDDLEQTSNTQPARAGMNFSKVSVNINDTIQSRYSVTDYFKKYPRTQTNVSFEPKNAWGKSETRPYPRGDAPYVPPLENIMSSESATVTPRSVLTVSTQEELYRNTDLDTSISSIQDTESVCTATSLSTLSAFDDHAFQAGLASLDANIARIQESLKRSMVSK